VKIKNDHYGQKNKKPPGDFQLSSRFWQLHLHLLQVS